MFVFKIKNHLIYRIYYFTFIFDFINIELFH